MARVIRADQRGPRIVPALVADAAVEAQAILERAHAQAEILRARGLAEGHEEGRNEGRAELAAKLLELAQERERMLSALEPQAIEIAMQATKRIVHQELVTRPEAMREIVTPLLQRLRRAERVTLRVHPDDQDALATWLDSLRASGTLTSPPELQSDPTLSRGSCVVISDIGSLDARVETQLQALARALGVK